MLTLAISHDLLGLTSRLADNISANVIGLALGTVFRYLTYKRFVFAAATTVPASFAARVDAGAVAQHRHNLEVSVA